MHVRKDTEHESHWVVSHCQSGPACLFGSMDSPDSLLPCLLCDGPTRQHLSGKMAVNLVLRCNSDHHRYYDFVVSWVTS